MLSPVAIFLAASESQEIKKLWGMVKTRSCQNVFALNLRWYKNALPLRKKIKY